MLETIGESAVRMTTRTDNNLAVEHKDVALEKADKAVEERPVESSQESARPEPETEYEGENGGYDIEDDQIFFEKYDKNGNVIYRLPPEQKPIDEHA